MSAQPPGSEGRWVTQQEAAQELGISTEAVRMRVRRGSLDSRKDEQGRVVVRMVADRTETAQETAQETARQPSDPSELVEALEARIESLERSLEHERESGRRKDTIIMQMAQRIPELEATQPEPAFSNQTKEEPAEEAEETEAPAPAPEPEPKSTLGQRLRRWFSG